MFLLPEAQLVEATRRRTNNDEIAAIDIWVQFDVYREMWLVIVCPENELIQLIRFA